MTKIIMVVVTGRLFRDGIRRVLEQEDRQIVTDYELLSQVTADLVSTVEPDLFVVGIGDRASSADAFCHIREIRAVYPKARWIVLSRRDDEVFLYEVAKSGIDGFLLEDSPEEVLRLMAELVLLGHCCVPVSLFSALKTSVLSDQPYELHSSSEGKIYNQPSSTDLKQINLNHQDWVSSNNSLVIKIDEQKNSPLDRHALASDAHRKRAMTLSEREREIMNCLVGGHSNKIIARDLGISEATVKVHVKALLRKLQVSNRTQAAICALSLLNDPAEIKNLTSPSVIAKVDSQFFSLGNAND